MMGGAIYEEFKNDIYINYTTKIVWTTFENNKAFKEGGAVKYTLYHP